MDVKIRNKFIEIKYSVSYGLVRNPFVIKGHKNAQLDFYNINKALNNMLRYINCNY